MEGVPDLRGVLERVLRGVGTRPLLGRTISLPLPLTSMITSSSSESMRDTDVLLGADMLDDEAPRGASLSPSASEDILLFLLRWPSFGDADGFTLSSDDARLNSSKTSGKTSFDRLNKARGSSSSELFSGA